MSMDGESIESRQNNELEALNAIYGDEIKDLRGKSAWNKWQPLNLKISLKPSQGSSGIHEVYAKLDLHITCTATYPNTSPRIKLENSKGVPAGALLDLLTQLQAKADTLRGEEMIFTLSQHVQDFLLQYNKPTNSFYEEMLKRQKEQELKEWQARQIERESIQQEVKQRQEMLKLESRMRRSEGEPEIEQNTAFSGDSLDNSPEYCSEHNDAVVIEFDDREVQRGRCLKHSSSCNHVIFAGIDQESGQSVIINQWLVEYRQSNDSIAINKQISGIDQEFNYLKRLRHPNLGRYLAFRYYQDESGAFIVYILQEFIYGPNCAFFMNENFNNGIQLAQMIAKGVLNALDYLHRNNVVHRDICETCVYLGGNNVILINHSLHRRLSDLCKRNNATIRKKSDIYHFGAFLLRFLQSKSAESAEITIPTSIPPDLYDFLARCLHADQLQRPTATQLLQHPFLVRHSLEMSPKAFSDHGEHDDDDIVLDLDAQAHIRSLETAAGQSRLKAEFQFVQHLGQGAFGAVIKARNLLDDRYYAIKCVRLNPKNRQLNKKIVREVKLLSSLDHENVVRYYNSWIESTFGVDGGSTSSGRSSMLSDNPPRIARKNEFTLNDNIEEMAPPMKNVSITYDSKSQMAYDPSSEEESSDGETNWDYNVDSDSDSDGIEFAKGSDTPTEHSSTMPKLPVQSPTVIDPKSFRIDHLYIQMEYCDKSTLRSVIDDAVYAKTELVWRLFREIVEGLGYIHEQGMIHRDLKPVNIFLDYDYHVKIGDFGLATNIKKKSNNLVFSINKHLGELTPDESKTGQIGTALYTAPELMAASKAVYNQKVDIYSLGIIFFEMSYRPFDTNMERIQILTGLRKKQVYFPDDYRAKEYEKQRSLIGWMLDHDFSKRPTCKELLKSEYVPPPVLEERELRDLIRHTISNPQLKDYKYLIAACFNQSFIPAQDITYDKDLAAQSTLKFVQLYDFAKKTIVQIFKQHGGQALSTPLLMPKSQYYNGIESCVKLMTHFGGIVSLPYDLRVPFARYVASNSVTFLRRYAIERVYREKKVFGFQPRELYECAFDIVTPTPGNLITDAEVLYIVHEIINKLPGVRDKHFVIKLNHAALIKAILLHFDIKENHEEIFQMIQEDKDWKVQRNQLSNYLIQLGLSDNSIATLINLFNSEFEVGKAGNSLQMITKKRSGEAAGLAKLALQELKTIVNNAELFGVTFDMLIMPGMVYNAQHYSGVLYQFVCEVKKKHKDDTLVVFAAGGRYDSMIGAYRKIMDDANMLNTTVRQSAVGISISLDKLVQTMQKIETPPKLEALDCAVCSIGTKLMLKEKAKMAQMLWHAGVRCVLIESTNWEEIQEQCAELKVAHVAMLKDSEHGSVRVRSWDAERFQERTCRIGELVELVQRTLKSWGEAAGEQPMAIARSESKTSCPQSQAVLFATVEKLSANARKRYETQIRAHLEALFARLSGNVVVLALNIEGGVIKTIASFLDFEPEQAFHKSVELVIERHQRHKKYIIYICDDIYEQKLKKTKPIVVLFSLIDTTYKVII